MATIPGIGELNATTLSSAFSQAWFWIQIILFIGLIVILFFLIKYLLSYNIHTVIEEKVNNNIIVQFRRAKIRYDKKKDGQNLIQRIQIMGIKKPVMYPVYSKDDMGNVVANNRYDKKGNIIPTLNIAEYNPQKSDDVKQLNYRLFAVTRRGKYALRFLKDGDEYTAVPWNNSEIEEYLRQSQPVRQQWANNVFREGMTLFAPEKGFWEKYGSVVMMGSAFVVIMIIFVFLFNKFDNLQSLSGSLNNYADAMKQFAQAVRETNVQNIK